MKYRGSENKIFKYACVVKKIRKYHCTCGEDHLEVYVVGEYYGSWVSTINTRKDHEWITTRQEMFI